MATESDLRAVMEEHPWLDFSSATVLLSQAKFEVKRISNSSHWDWTGVIFKCRKALSVAREIAATDTAVVRRRAVHLG
jgi:hypothetical protein